MAVKLREQDNGVVVYQVTEDAFRKSNIYCELPYCSADSRVFVFARKNPACAPNDTEYIACEFGAWETEIIGRGLGDWEVNIPGQWLGGPAMTHTGIFCYRRAVKGAQEVVRLNLATGDSDVVFHLPEGFHPRGCATMSPDGRYYAHGVTLGFNPQMFGIELIDLASGSREIIFTDPFICNPHTQFEPTDGKQLMVQHNRGCQFRPDGARVKLVGEEGATELVVDIPDGKVTRLEVGLPYTTPITGHEAWVPGTGEILLTVSPKEDYTPEKGNLLGVRAGEHPRVVATGYRFNHLGASPCGRFFFCDDWQAESKLLAGSVKTGKVTVICEAHTSMGTLQNTHAHSYLSPDLKWLVFNSDQSGRSQIHVAAAPKEIIENLERT